MRELIYDPFYELIEHYPRCGVDYCLIEGDMPHQGYRSHKDAVLFATLKVIERDIDTQLRDELAYGGKAQDEPFPWSLDIGKARGHQIDADTLLHVPEILRTDGPRRPKVLRLRAAGPLEGRADSILVRVLGDPTSLGIRTGRLSRGQLRAVPAGNRRAGSVRVDHGLVQPL